MVILIVLALMLAGCTVRLSPPAAIAEPRSVYLLDHGYHASLLLSREDGSLVRYSYGEWRYFAKEQQGLSGGLRALLWPTRGTLARRVLEPPGLHTDIQAQVRTRIDASYPMTLEAECVEALMARLDGIYLQGYASRHDNPSFDLSFVPHPRRYTLWHNCNHAIAGWLDEMGVEVKGWALLSRWQLAKP